MPTAADADVGARQSCLGADAQAAVNVAGGTAVVAATERQLIGSQVESTRMSRAIPALSGYERA